MGEQNDGTANDRYFVNSCMQCSDARWESLSRGIVQTVV